MMPSTKRMPPPGARGPQLFASPFPRPPTTIGVIGPPPPPPRPPRPPPPPPPPPPPGPAAAGAGAVPFGPHPVVRVFIHFRLRFLTVDVFTCFSALNRLPLRSPE